MDAAETNAPQVELTAAGQQSDRRHAMSNKWSEHEIRNEVSKMIAHYQRQGADQRAYGLAWSDVCMEVRKELTATIDEQAAEIEQLTGLIETANRMLADVGKEQESVFYTHWKRLEDEIERLQIELEQQRAIALGLFDAATEPVQPC